MKSLITLLTSLALPGLTLAQIAPDVHPTYFGALTIYVENDTFSNTDQDYTSGVRVSWTSPSLRHFADDSSAGGIASFFDDAPLMGDSSYDRNVAISIGQSIFTPVDVRNPNLVVSERPYAAWLYAGLGLVWKKPHVKNTLLFNLGVVGPWALGEQAQHAVHEALGQRSPEGWNHQLRNEVGINIAYERKWRLRDRYDRNGVNWDFLPYIGASLGNVYTHANLGGEFRLGWNLPDDFGTGAISDSANTPTPLEGVAAQPWANRFGCHLFLRAEGRAVLRNIFLDGNTFRESHSVDKRPFVADLSAGFAINWRNSKLSYAYVYRTLEYDGQSNEQIFGSITLTIFF
ncbi:MAG: lipid A deacylase LpxR family protein [Prosthecobacter sp.]|jgi:lipid A 3-O-deacylase|uniref:lipid A deacylase LpxR family protein n=1 Tax=Prosthecobacter sp. TaxID=1965333 RepID=UPI0019DD1DED|nr:lipid A deacylase LpxR family protein [Prosthecobacter sp.]MBE2286004.1 lipid A deacylase LpxR family protein [Prosthecobacter sp.]